MLLKIDTLLNSLIQYDYDIMKIVIILIFVPERKNTEWSSCQKSYLSITDQNTLYPSLKIF